MAVRRFRRRARSTRRVRRGRRVGGRLMGRGRRLAVYNPKPIFTETYSYLTAGHDYICEANGGVLLTANVDKIPQLAQYTNLYTKYRILKATFICLPKWNNSQDQNAAQYNASNSTYGYGALRAVYAINDSPAQVDPTSEAIVLQDNGAKIKMVPQSGLRITCRPVPDTKDANGVQMTSRGSFINFAATNVSHYGVSLWLSQPVTATGSNAVLNSVYGYVKLTFQLADPR